MNYLTYINNEKFGTIIHFIAEDGRSCISIQRPSDEKDCAYLYALNVHESVRKQGRANEILQFAEDYLTKHTNTKYILLDAHKGWLTDWYQSKGYRLYKYNKEEDLNMFSKIIEGN